MAPRGGATRPSDLLRYCMINDLIAIEKLAPKNNSAKRNFVEPVQIIHNATRRTKVSLCILGSWSVTFPPYALAKLTALSRAAGYETHTYDFNAHTYNFLHTVDKSLKDVYKQPYQWMWQHKQEFEKRILPFYKELLEEYIEQLLGDNPDVIGFSTYFLNMHATEWVAEKIRKTNPNILLVIGGPQCNEIGWKKPDVFDYMFVGESEQTFLDFLENVENNNLPDTPILGGLYNLKRVDLDSIPFPDYRDYVFSMYSTNKAICSELSRGCVARCTYCTEVWYWKFRGRNSNRVVDELEDQVVKYGVNFVHFVDSLVNGHLQGLKDTCEEIIRRKLNFSWWGYARHDGRMDLDFYKLLKQSGCSGLNYGLESGSNKVLKLVNKGNTVEEIQQNLIDAAKVGIASSVCLVVGAPGEETEDHNFTMNLVWNNRKRMFAVSPGNGLGDTPGSAYDDRKRFNISDRDSEALGGWYTLDFKNTRLHRFIRVKILNILLDIGQDHDGTIENYHGNGAIKNHYSIQYNDTTINEDIPYDENFDYNIINTDNGVFADSVMNEMFGLFRLLWRARGAYDMTLKFDPTTDAGDFGNNVDSYWKYESIASFSIDKSGKWQLKSNHLFSDTWDFKDKNFEHSVDLQGQW